MARVQDRMGCRCSGPSWGVVWGRRPAGTGRHPRTALGDGGAARHFPAGRRWGARPWKGAPRRLAAAKSRQSQVTTPTPPRRAARRSPYMGRRGAGGAGPAWAGRPTRWAPPRGQTEPPGEDSLHGQGLPSGARKYPEAPSRLRPARHPALQGLNLTDSTGD